MLENGMLVGADAEWERQNAPSLYDTADIAEMECYAYDEEKIHEVVATVCGLDNDDLTEDVAVLVYENLDDKRATDGLRQWFRYQNPSDYIEWKRCK